MWDKAQIFKNDINHILDAQKIQNQEISYSDKITYKSFINIISNQNWNF